MSTVSIVLLIILAVLVIVLLVLYFLGKRMQKKQDEQQAQIDASKQTVSMLIIDKKKMKIKTLEAFREEVHAFVESSIQSLRELNPGKEPLHG